MCTQAIKTSEQKELEGTESGPFCKGEKRNLKKKKSSMKFKGMFQLLTEQRGGKCSCSDPQQQETTGLFSLPAFTLTSFILAIKVRNNGRVTSTPWF